MNTKKLSSNRRSFIKGASSASLATILATEGGTAFAHSTTHINASVPVGPLGPPAKSLPYTYITENSWGPITEWHPATDLSFNIDTGTGYPPANLSWRDQQGNSFAISFASDMSTFFGYFQRYNEGPIAYRGKLINGAWKKRL